MASEFITEIICAFYSEGEQNSFLIYTDDLESRGLGRVEYFSFTFSFFQNIRSLSKFSTAASRLFYCSIDHS